MLPPRSQVERFWKLPRPGPEAGAQSASSQSRSLVGGTGRGAPPRSGTRVGPGRLGRSATTQTTATRPEKRAGPRGACRGATRAVSAGGGRGNPRRLLVSQRDPHLPGDLERRGQAQSPGQEWGSLGRGECKSPYLPSAGLRPRCFVLSTTPITVPLVSQSSDRSGPGGWKVPGARGEWPNDKGAHPPPYGTGDLWQ